MQFHVAQRVQSRLNEPKEVGLNLILLMENIMRTTQQFSITLPNEMADIVKSKVAHGEYATESAL